MGFRGDRDMPPEMIEGLTGASGPRKSDGVSADFIIRRLEFDDDGNVEIEMAETQEKRSGSRFILNINAEQLAEIYEISDKISSGRSSKQKLVNDDF